MDINPGCDIFSISLFWFRLSSLCLSFLGDVCVDAFKWGLVCARVFVFVCVCDERKITQQCGNDYRAATLSLALLFSCPGVCICCGGRVCLCFPSRCLQLCQCRLWTQTLVIVCICPRSPGLLPRCKDDGDYTNPSGRDAVKSCYFYHTWRVI